MIGKDTVKKFSIPKISLMLFLFFLTDSGFSNFTGMLGYMFLRLGIIILSSIILLLSLPNIKKTDMLLVFTLFTLAVICIVSYQSGVGLIALVVHSMMIISCYIIAKHWSFESFALTFIDTCIIIALVGLLQYVVLICFPSAQSFWPKITYSPTLSGSYHYEVYTVALAHMHFDRYSFIPRFYSLFWEPGVCQAYFNIAIILALKYVQGKKRFFCLILFTVIVILTRSTTGYAALAFLLVLFLLNKSRGQKREMFLKVAILLGVVVGIVMWDSFATTDWYRSLFGKIIEKSGSYESRFSSITGNLMIIAKNPLAGVGMSASDDILRNIMNDSSIHQTNTLLNYLSSYGIIIGGCCLIAWYQLSKSMAVEKRDTFFIIGCLGCLLCGENFLRSFPINLMMCYGARELYSKISHRRTLRK